MPTYTAEEIVELKASRKTSERPQCRIRKSTDAEKLWKALSCIFMFLTVALSVAVGIYASLAQSGSNEAMHPCRIVDYDDSSGMPENKDSGIFRGLTENEFEMVRDFMLKQEALNLTLSASATLNSNYIYMIEDYLPSKDDTLKYSEDSESSVSYLKRAKVVVFAGGEQPKAVKEYLVYPIPDPHTFVPVIAGNASSPINWKARPVCQNVEEPHAARFVKNELLDEKVKTLLKESFGQWVGDDCDKSCLYVAMVPRSSPESDDRHIQILFNFDPVSVEGYYLYNVPFTLVIYTAQNSDVWAIKHVYYNGIRFESISGLVFAYESGTLTKIKLPPTEIFAGKYASPIRRGENPNNHDRKPPSQYSLDGPRFTLNHRHVEYLSWSFDLYFQTIGGLHLFNVKHNGRSVAFEIGMQNIAVLYGGEEPANFFNNYFDDGYSLGTQSSPLIRGGDCIADALYVDCVVYDLGADRSRRIKDAACIFENRNSVPLRRHYSAGNFAFTLPDSVLVVRQILTVWNYDYILDYEFHQNGVIEAKVSSTGYVAITNSVQSRYGYTLNANLHAMANIHAHFFHFKFDVDIIDRKNCLKYINFELENTTNPMVSGSFQQMRLHEKQVLTEQDSLVTYEFSKPKYYLIQNNKNVNSLGHRKGYRVYSSHFADVMLPLTNPQMNGASWAKHQLAVTKQKDSERGTFSMYTQGDPNHPVVDFQTFYADNEPIVDEDLVAWVTVGMHHIPSAEDIPVTTTSGKTLVASLIPFNYFDEDPSISSSDAFIIRQSKSGQANVVSYLNKSQTCIASERDVILRT